MNDYRRSWMYRRVVYSGVLDRGVEGFAAGAVAGITTGVAAGAVAAVVAGSFVTIVISLVVGGPLAAISGLIAAAKTNNTGSAIRVSRVRSVRKDSQ